MQGRTERCECKPHPLRYRRYYHRCSYYGPNQISEVHRDSSRPPVDVGAAEGQAKEEAGGESEKSEEVSGEKGRNRNYASMLDCIILSTVAIYTHDNMYL